MSKLNWSTSNSQITDEIIYVSSSASVGLGHDMFYSKVAKPIVISTGAGGTGTVLAETTDYTVGGTISTVPANIASIAPDVIYSTIAITNAAYHSTTLYCSYYPLGDLWEASDVTQLITGTRLATKDISGSNQTTLLTAYEPGGGTYLQDGGKIHVSWENGDGTYYHKFTSAWNLKNDFVDLAPGDGTSTFAWCGYGSGGLTLIKDEANLQWIVETDGCFDRTGIFSGQRVTQMTSGRMDYYATTTVPNSSTALGANYRSAQQNITFPIPFSSSVQMDSASVMLVEGLNSVNTPMFMGGEELDSTHISFWAMTFISIAVSFFAKIHVIGTWRS